MVITLALVTLLLVLGAAVYDMRETDRVIREGRHSVMTTPGAQPDTRI
jgi:hypothetical protein